MDKTKLEIEALNQRIAELETLVDGLMESLDEADDEIANYERDRYGSCCE